MNLQEIITFTKPFMIQGQEGIFRLYNAEKDNIKLVTTLFTKMNNRKGLEELHTGDTSTFIGSKENFRLVAELHDILIATITLMKKSDFKEKKIVNMYSVVTIEKYRGTGISGKFFDFAVVNVKMVAERKTTDELVRSLHDVVKPQIYCSYDRFADAYLQMPT